ncbi:MAG: MlrC C-terminal domain-containing protein, partial [Myxococcota bacterium]
LLERGVTAAALGMLWDPAAVAICHEAGIGASFALRLGGKSGPASGTPLDAPVTVRGLARGYRQPPEMMGTLDAGDAAWISIAGIDVVLCSIRVQTFAPEVFSDLGIGLAGKRLLVVKSSQHFHAQFAPLAHRIVKVAAGGALDMDFARFDYRRRDARWWPRVADPLGDAGDVPPPHP